MNSAGVFAALWLTTLAAAGWVGWDYGRADLRAEQRAADRRAVAQQAAVVEDVAKVNQTAGEQAQRVQIIYRDRVKKVVEYVEKRGDRVQCLDAAGVQLFNDIGAGVGDALGDGLRPAAPAVDGRE